MIVTNESPFGPKKIGKEKLYREKFGKKHVLSQGESTLIFENPFDVAKINKAEFKWFPENVTVDLFIADSSDGIYQKTVLGIPENEIIPDLVLNQHGHSVGIGQGEDCDTSEYDATLLKGMQVVSIFDNGSEEKNVCMNIVLHRVEGVS